MSCFGRGLLALSLGMALCVAPWGAGSAAAQGEHSFDFGLSVSAPEGAACTGAAELRREIEARVDRLVFTDDPRPSRRIDIAIARDDAADGWSAAIRMRDGEGRSAGERSIEAAGASCAVLDEALVVVISTLIGIAETPPEEPAANPVPELVPDSEHEDEHEDEHESEPEYAVDPDSDPVRYSVDLGARGDIGFMPGLVPGAWLGLALDFGGWSLRVAGNVWPYAQDDLGLGGRARFMAAGGELDACLAVVRGAAAAFELCGGAQVGVMVVATRGLATTADRVEPAARVQVGPRFRLAIGAGFGLIAGLEAAIPLTATRFFLLEADGKPRYYHTVELGLSGQVGAYFVFSS